MLPRHRLGNYHISDSLLRRQNRRQWLTSVATAAAAAWAGGIAGLAWAQLPRQAERASPLADPREFTLELPSGPVRPGNNRCVQCNSGGEEVIARVLAEVGSSLVLILPNGRLLALPAEETTNTDKPFTAATAQQMAAELTARQFAGFKTHVTRRHLFLYNTSDLFYTGASRILEPMYSGVYLYAKGQKIDVHEPEVPLVVIMFRTEQEFQMFQRMPSGVVAYYSPITNFVVMYEQSRLSEMAPELALRQAISTIAHEGAHQILHNIGVQQRMSHWPMWLCEGLAEYFAPTTVGSRLKWKGPGELNELRLYQLDQYLRRRPPGTHGDLVTDTVEAAQLTATGYATAWALTHYLVQRQAPRFFGFLQEVSRIGPFEGGGRPDKYGHLAENRAMFVRYFGNDMDALEDQVVLHLQKLLARG
jgi:Protein of unknown function (DUF1570)